MKQHRLQFTLALLGCALAASRAPAAVVLVAPGAPPVTLTGSTFAADVPTGSTVLLGPTSYTLPNVGAGTSGVLVVEAIKEAGTGTVDILAQLRNTSTNGAAMASLALTNYTPFTTSVDYLTDVPTGIFNPGGVFVTGSVTAADAQRGLAGGNILFDFSPAGGSSNLGPGTTSNVLLIKTNALAADIFGTATASTTGSNTGSTGALGVIEPSIPSSVPEPGSLVLGAISGAFGLLTWGTRRRLTGRRSA